MLPFIIIGIVSGSVYGLAGVGLVLTYKTSGIFNFAQGALATVAAYAFYYLNVDAGLAWPVAALISVFALGAVLGLGFEFMARRVARGPLAWRIVATIGIVLIVEAVFTIVHGSSTLTTPHFLSQSTVQIFGAFVTYEQIIVTVISLGAAIALYVFFRTARLGKAMRAVVDDPDLLGLAGTSPERVRRWAWVIGCVFAATSGVLLAPSVPLDPNVLTLLIVQAFGAAAIGGFTSLPLTLAGGLADRHHLLDPDRVHQLDLAAGRAPAEPAVHRAVPRHPVLAARPPRRPAARPAPCPDRLAGARPGAAGRHGGGGGVPGPRAVLGRLPDHRLDPGPHLRDPAALARPARQDLGAGVAVPHHVRGHRRRRASPSSAAAGSPGYRRCSSAA